MKNIDKIMEKYMIGEGGMSLSQMGAFTVKINPLKKQGWTVTSTGVSPSNEQVLVHLKKGNQTKVVALSGISKAIIDKMRGKKD